MIEVIPTGSLDEYDWYLHRVRNSSQKPTNIFIIYTRSPQSESLSNNLEQSIRFWQKIPIRKILVQNSMQWIYQYFSHEIFNEYKEPYYFNLGSNAGLEVVLGLYNALQNAPPFSRAYEVIRGENGQFEVRFISSPLFLKKTSSVIFDVFAKNPENSFTVDDLLDNLGDSKITREYLIKILESFERKGILFSESMKYNRKIYRIH